MPEVEGTQVQRDVFRGFQELAYREAGILLRDNKSVLVASRIAKRMRELGVQEPGAYLAHLRADREGTEVMMFLDAITTNFTSFFREPDHFEVLAREVRSRVNSGIQNFRIWCAAAATGEEPYTLAITLAEALRGTGASYQILATDISRRALEFAKRGRYEESRLAQVPDALRRRYFHREAGVESGEWFRVNDELRSRIVFGRINLAQPPFPLRGELDVVFCRNVMIYFDAPVRRRLVSAFEQLLRSDGLLVVAHSETLERGRIGLRAESSSVYRKAAA